MPKSRTVGEQRNMPYRRNRKPRKVHRDDDTNKRTFKCDTQLYTNHTGGAKGSDLYWQKMATKYNVTSKVYSFDKHGGKNPARVVLSNDELRLADKHLIKANKTLNRRFPTRNKFTDNLLRRNWYQVKDTNTVYAVGILMNDRKSCDGGTGWTVQMAIDNNRPVYVYDCIWDKKTKKLAGSLKWYSYDVNVERFVECDTPKLTHNFTGIGTRSLPNEGRQAIEEVFKKTFEITN